MLRTSIAIGVPSVTPSNTPRQDLDLVGLAALGGDRALAGAAAVEVALDVGRVDADPGRHAVDDHADRGPVRLAEGGDDEQLAERGATMSRPARTLARAARFAAVRAACRLPGRGERGDRARAERLVRRRPALELVEVGRADVGARLGDPGLAAAPRSTMSSPVWSKNSSGWSTPWFDERADHLPVRRGHAEVAVLVGRATR